jgi:hypothetical protein
MSAKIYSAFEELTVPTFSFGNGASVEDYNKANDQYIVDMKAKLIEHGYKGKNSGEVIKFPVADGHALYMVISMRPLQLMHIPIVDAWEFQYVHLLTAKEVSGQIEANKKWDEFINKV